MGGPWEDYAPAEPEGKPWEDYAEPEISPAAGARAAAVDQSAGPALSRMEYLTGLAQKAAQGVTFDYGDEIAAAVGSLPNLVTGGRYGKTRKQILEDVRGDEKRFDEANPKAAVGAQVAGALGPGLLTGSALARAAPWILPRAGGILRTAVGSGATAVPGGAVAATGRIEGEGTIGDYGTEALKGGALAGAFGAGVGGAGRAASGVVGPWINRTAERLHAAGVRLTPGEIIGGYAKRAEDIAGSVPFLGHLIRNRQGEGIESFNRAAYNETLAPLGQRYQQMFNRGNAEVGHESLEDMTALLDRRYGAVVPRLTARADPQLTTDIANISTGMPGAVRPLLADAYRRYVEPTIDQATGEIDGRGLQTAFQGLRLEGERLMRSQADPYHYEAGQALMALRERLEDAAGRYSSPGMMTRFRNINDAYARFARVRDAASKVGTDMGEFTPAQLHSSVRALDRSAGKGAVARGNSLLQNLSGPGRSVMTRKVNDSGTPERAALMAAIVAPGMALKSITAGAVPLGAAFGLYTRAGNRAFQSAATAGGPWRQRARELLQRGTIAGAPAAGTAIEAGYNGDIPQ